MKQIILFLAFTAMSSADLGGDGLRVRFGLTMKLGVDYFVTLPTTVDNAIAQNWTKTSRPTSPLPELAMYCKQCTLCLLFDLDTRRIAGLQVGLPMNDFSNALYSWEDQGFISWKPSICAGTYMTKQVYFVSAKYLSKSVAERKQAALAEKVLQGKSIWVMGYNQQLMEIPTDAKGIVDTGFTKQACIPLMGQHYYYKLDTHTKCTAKTMLNWFPLCDGDNLTGLGFIAFGALPEKTGVRDYFERPPKLAVQAIVPRGPKCLYELADKPSITTMHIYFVEKPWHIGCLPFKK